MASGAEDDKVLNAHIRKLEADIPNLDESKEEFSEEEEFPPEEVEDSQDLRFISRGPQDPRLISSSNAQLQSSNVRTQGGQSQTYTQNPISQSRKTPLVPRNMNPGTYDRGRG